MIWFLLPIGLAALLFVMIPVCDWLERRAEERDRAAWNRWLRGER